MKSHVYLRNEFGHNNSFGKSRGFSQKNNESIEELNKNYIPQKERLAHDYARYFTERQYRKERRSLELSHNFDHVSISFFKAFDYELERTFLNDFGMSVVELTNFNQNGIFRIDNEMKFALFLDNVNAFTKSTKNEVPSECKIITTILDFHCLSTNRIKNGVVEGGLYLLKLASDIKYESLKGELTEYLCGIGVDPSIYKDYIETSYINNANLDLILDNFDNVLRVQTIRIPKIRPNSLGEREFVSGLNVRIPADAPIIGIIDTGIINEDCLQNVIKGPGIDLTDAVNPQPYHVRCYHGSTVASLASFGWNYFKGGNDITADAYVFPIKAQADEEGIPNPIEIIHAIIDAHVIHGIKIFNLSLNGMGKAYNSEISLFAQMLDQIAYDYNLLVFISTGNNDIITCTNFEEYKSLFEGATNDYSFLDYPHHFYNPHIQDIYDCENTNICQPSDSLNNITVGALADNMDVNNSTDLTDNAQYPAYYTRKFYIDYYKKINNTDFNKYQENNNLFKPDIVMPGGDIFAENSQMQVLGEHNQLNQLLYTRSAGTSLAAPLAANFAAKIIHRYPKLNMQSVKALLINSAKEVRTEYLDNMVEKLKHEELIINPKDDNRTLSSKFNSKRLNHFISGHGMPKLTSCLESSDKSVTLIIEDSIKYDCHKTINLSLPQYLGGYQKKNTLLKITSTLCYKFQPVVNDSLSYNPLHIAFTVGRCANPDDKDDNASIFANNEKQYIDENVAIHSHKESWSEDFFPINKKVFCNTQKHAINIGVKELEKTNYKLTIAIRCSGRQHPLLEEYVQNKEHAFSLVLRIDETPSVELSNHNLYDELSLCNNLEAINNAITEADIDIQ